MVNKIRRKLKQIQKEIPECDSAVKAIGILIDFLICKKRYHVQFEEYRQYSFHKLRHSARKEYVTEYDVIKVMPELYNKGDMRHTLDNKSVFNTFFGDLLGRDYCHVSKEDEVRFLDFVSAREKIIIKPTNSWCGHGVSKIAIPAESDERKALFRNLISNYGEFLAEECFVQHAQISKLNPDSVNTIRVISMVDAAGKVHIPFASIRIGRKGSAVDNFCAGGMAAAIDAASGIVVTHAFDGAGNQYFVHPDSEVQIIGFQIPEWNELIKTITKAAERIPTMRFIGWDVVVREDGKVCLIEGNSNPGARTLQLPLKKGVKPVYYQYLGKF